ncbi:uncharacterized protein FPRO_10824 [Fusarium proliferatum ET1]|uniref:Uncharacterized protein n=1 Tax=Fusarium proliferatum (strain ET1) TaxID=1227346 RepID=A0A1L7VNL8_FUSPR|nr:uncharacterized protein FPRO_10824 [Fusarium proliferatum ET1]CZR41235.1 uncharacterized protein FPRO_10824 [Fusarium proliferatum ET1]
MKSRVDQVAFWYWIHPFIQLLRDSIRQDSKFVAVSRNGLSEDNLWNVAQTPKTIRCGAREALLRSSRSSLQRSERGTAALRML